VKEPKDLPTKHPFLDFPNCNVGNGRGLRLKEITIDEDPTEFLITMHDGTTALERWSRCRASRRWSEFRQINENRRSGLDYDR
jgi:hypothetical protein